MADLAKNLEQLEGVNWGEPDRETDTNLVIKCHDLRRRPIEAMTDEDLRVLIGQSIGLDYLIPVALRRLEADPFSSGDLYPGALLVAVLAASKDWWLTNPEAEVRALQVLYRVEDLRDSIDSEIVPAGDKWRALFEET
ncbi:contact-dependent growth inhibition system immunity protein [Haloferula sp.]|uniref:contact-dependent growth inhibition system immunity protein n=1 Tax=Haloferula sp. TaxID=2497595 RepID=UPI00329BDE05